MQTQTPKFRAWRAAEKEAHEAERRLHAEMLQFASNASPGPSPELVLLARAKRAKAHALFADAMQELKELARSLHHRKILTAAATSLNSANRQPEPGSDDSRSRSLRSS